MEFERDELEVKHEFMNETIHTLDDKLEVAYGESRKLRYTLNALKVEMHEKLIWKDVEIVI